MSRKSKTGLVVAGLAGAGGLGWYLWKQSQPKPPPMPVSIAQAVNQQSRIDYRSFLAPAMGRSGLEQPVNQP